MSDNKVENKKVFDVEVDGRTLKLAVLRPSHKVSQQAALVYNRAFRQAVKPEDGKAGAIVRAALEGVLRDQKLWDDGKQAKFEELHKKLAEAEKKLAAGGIKLSEARGIAIQMRRDRYELRSLLADRNSLDIHTAEAQAENTRFNFLVSACTVHADTGKPYWASDEAYLSDIESPAANAAASRFANLIYNLDEDYEKKLPENAWLLKYKFCNDKLHLIDKVGRLIDAEGRLVDEKGRYIDESGQLIDRDGNPLTEDGDFKVDFTPFIDDETGEPVVVAETAAAA